MVTFLKVQLASIIGSIADFLTTFILVNFFHSWYIAGNLAGNIVGAVLLFLIDRGWVFRERKARIFSQSVKFILVWMGNLLLSGLLVYLFTQFIGLNYLLSKLISSVILGISYQYLLLKKYVFG